MEPDTVATLFGTVLLLAVVAVAVGVFVPRGRQLMTSWAVPLVGAVGAGAMAGSLYFSEVADYVPCELCWYQRIAMYPIGIIGVIAAVRRDRSVLPYLVVLAVGGASVSVYHVQLQLFPEQSTFCQLDNPCTASWVDAFGWMTIPQMALASFALVIAVGSTALFVGWRQSSPVAVSDDATPASNSLTNR